MQLTSVLVAAAALLAPVYSSAIIPMGKRQEGLGVELASVGGTKLKVSVTNNAGRDVEILMMGSFFDESPVQHVNIYNTACDTGDLPDEKCQSLPFQGLQRSVDIFALTDEDFQPLANGETVDAEFDIADTFDLEAGEYRISATGSLPFSNPGCPGISGVLPYRSNEITVTVTEASSATSLTRRTALQANSCTAEQKEVVNKALKRASTLASEAAKAALNGDARIFEYFFRTSDSATRKDVAARFEAIAKEAAAGDNGNVTYKCCGDKMGACQKGVLAYAVSGPNTVVNCPDFYNMAEESDKCAGKDHALTVIHELTHLGAVYSPGTGDHAYGYDGVIALNKEQAVMNADTYLYFASSVNLDCEPGAGKGPKFPDWMIKEILEKNQ